MNVKYTIFTVLAAFLVLTVNSSSKAVDTRDIDKVRNKSVLDSEDFQIIDNFVGDAVQELVETIDLASIAKIRTDISSRSSSATGIQAQYAEQFSESAHKYISEAFEQVDKLPPEEQRFKVILSLNLLILVDNLEDLRVAELAMKRLNDKSAVIRYWAVHSVTNSGITEQLNSGNSELAGRIAKQLETLVEGVGSETTALMAEFAANVEIRQGEDLLVKIADIRISKYADWNVDNELLDAVILKFLHKKISSAGQNKAAVAQRFGQLYSYVIQRYVNGRDFLSVAGKRRLASVLAETEYCCIWRLLGSSVPRPTIRTAVERGDYAALLLEHNRLLGDETKAGQLPLKLNFDYGKKPDGTGRTAPLS